MGQWVDMGYSLSLSQKSARASDARDERVASAVKRAILSPDGRALIDRVVREITRYDRACAGAGVPNSTFP